MNLKHLVAGVTSALAISSAAHAAVFVTTITGNVAESIDELDVFGFGAGSDLTGKSFTLTLTYDTELGVYANVPGNDVLSGPDNPFVSAALSIGGSTHDLHPTCCGIGVTGSTFALNLVGDGKALGNFTSAAVPALLATAFSTPIAQGGFLFEKGESYAFLAPTYGETIAQATGAIPEPATWALMIVGFGGAGTMLRRVRASVTAI